MVSVLQFPSAQIQGLVFLEQQIAELLRAHGADDELVNFATATTREIYHRNADAENYSFSIDLPAGISSGEAASLQTDMQAGIEKVRAENHAIIIRLIAELALCEVKNFQQKRHQEN